MTILRRAELLIGILIASVTITEASDAQKILFRVRDYAFVDHILQYPLEGRHWESGTLTVPVNDYIGISRSAPRVFRAAARWTSKARGAIQVLSVEVPESAISVQEWKVNPVYTRGANVRAVVLVGPEGVNCRSLASIPDQLELSDTGIKRILDNRNGFPSLEQNLGAALSRNSVDSIIGWLGIRNNDKLPAEEIRVLLKRTAKQTRTLALSVLMAPLSKCSEETICGIVSASSDESSRLDREFVATATLSVLYCSTVRLKEKAKANAAIREILKEEVQADDGLIEAYVKKAFKKQLQNRVPVTD